MVRFSLHKKVEEGVRGHSVSLTDDAVVSDRRDSPIEDPLDAYCLDGRASDSVKRVRKPAVRRAHLRDLRRDDPKRVVPAPPQRAPGPFVGEQDRTGWVANLAATTVGWRWVLRSLTEASRKVFCAKKKIRKGR